MKANYTRIMRTVTSSPWGILPGTLEMICGIIEARVNGAPAFTTDEIRAQMGARALGGVTAAAGGAVAVIPLVGVLAPKMNMMVNMSGGTSLDQFRAQFRRALADQTVKAIVVAIDSPGGSVVGCDETWTEIMQARGQKPIVASVDALMASAALWIGSACDSIEMTPSGEAGSLGVYLVHEDASAAEAAAGIKITYIASGISPYKVEGNSDEPLSPGTQAYLQSRVDGVAATFLAQAAKGRGLSIDSARKSFGMGRTLNATEALAAKMVDRIATFDQTVARLAGTALTPVGARAKSEQDRPKVGDTVKVFDARGNVTESLLITGDHTDVGRGKDGAFSAQCSCNAACACMSGGSAVCGPKCMTCAPSCACIQPAGLAKAEASAVTPAADVDVIVIEDDSCNICDDDCPCPSETECPADCPTCAPECPCRTADAAKAKGATEAALIATLGV